MGEIKNSTLAYRLKCTVQNGFKKRGNTYTSGRVELHGSPHVQTHGYHHWNKEVNETH
ncbi:MAG: hypothetical protein OXC64_05620 [Flavobacteriaceae bacterium]|nr:hypothetical protein [Flavobacteriaceae bacterium]